MHFSNSKSDKNWSSYEQKTWIKCLTSAAYGVLSMLTIKSMVAHHLWHWLKGGLRFRFTFTQVNSCEMHYRVSMINVGSESIDWLSDWSVSYWSVTWPQPYQKRPQSFKHWSFKNLDGRKLMNNNYLLLAHCTPCACKAASYKQKKWSSLHKNLPWVLTAKKQWKSLKVLIFP